MTRPLSWPTQQPEPTPPAVELAVRLPYPALRSSTQLYAALRSNWNLPSNVGMTRPLSWPTQQPEPTQQRRHDPAVELAYAATGTYPAGR